VSRPEIESGSRLRAAAGYNSSVMFAIALLALLDQYDRAAEKVRLPDDEVLRRWSAKSEAHRKIISMISDRKNWAKAFEIVDQKLGMLPSNPDIGVSVEDTDDKRPACSSGKEGRGTVRFNMRQLAPYQEKLDELEVLEKGGKGVKWIMPPMRMEAIIPHELTHVVTGGFEDLWLAEGLASYTAADDVVFYMFNHRKSRVDTLERVVPEADAYARGMAFLLWLEKTSGAEGVRTFARKVSREAVSPSRAAAEIAGQDWERIVLVEKTWSAEYIAQFKPAP
jgi:hypothetical protein